jgi:hypothetical protein
MAKHGFIFGHEYFLSFGPDYSGTAGTWFENDGKDITLNIGWLNRFQLIVSVDRRAPSVFTEA